MWAVLGMCVIAVTIFTAGFLIGQGSVGVVDGQRIHPPDNGVPPWHPEHPHDHSG